MSLKNKPPLLVFAAVDLLKGSGGIAELSRQAIRTLFEMHLQKLIRLELHILQGSGMQADDELLSHSGFADIHWYSGNRWKFAFGLMRTKSDVQLLDHVGLARLPGLISPVLRQKYILFIHGVEIWDSNRLDYARAARNADLLIANSEYTARKARSKFPDIADIRVCLPGKDKLESFADISETAWPGLGPHAMLIVGRLCAEQRHKGHDQLIEAMPLILRSVPDAQLVVAGGGDDAKRLRLKANELNVADHVIFTGWVDESALSLLYCQCAVFVMPSEGDGFGLVFLEAMMHSVACVGLINGAAGEIFEDNVSGILIDREDQRGMALHLCALLRDENKRKTLARAAYDRYQTLFRASHYSKRLRSILMDYLRNSVNSDKTTEPSQEVSRERY